MSREEAALINFTNMINSIAFMAESYKNDVDLSFLDFQLRRYPLDLMNKSGGYSLKTTHFLDDEDDKPSHENFYVYSDMPRIGSYMYPKTDHLASINTYSITLQDGKPENIISVGFWEPETWMIRIEHCSTEFIIKNERGQNELIDISDEAQLFQYSLMNPTFPDFLTKIAYEGIGLILLSEKYNKIIMKSSGCIVDLGIKDFTKEFKE